MKFFYLIITFFVLSINSLFAQSFSRATGNWDNTPTNIWATTAGGVASKTIPLAADAVTIQNGDVITVTADATCASLNVTGATSTLIINPGVTLTVNGNVTGNGAITVNGTLKIAGNNTHSGGVAYTGTVDHIGSGTVRNTTYNNLTVSSGIGTLANTTVVNNILDVTSGTLSCGIRQLTINGTITGSNLTIGANTIIYGGAGAQNILPLTYNVLSLTGTGAKSLTGNTAVNSTFTLNSAGGLSCGTNDFILSAGVTHTAGPFVTGANTVTYNSVAAQNILGGTYGGNLTITGGNKTFVTAPSSITGLFLMDANVAGAQNVTFNGNVSYTSGTVNFTGGTITYANALAQNFISGSYSGLTLNGGAKTLIAAATELDVNGVFTQDANFSTGINNVTFSSVVNYNSGVINFGANTVTYDGGNQNVLATIYNNLTFASNGTKTLLGLTTVSANFSHIGSNSISCGTNNFVLNGLVTATSTGAIATGANTVTYNSASAQDIIKGTYSGDLTLQGAGAKTLTGTTTITGTTTKAANLSCGNNNLTFNGAVTNTSGTFSVGINTVVYGAAVPQIIIPTTYNNLTLQLAGSKSLSGNTTVNGAFSLNSVGGFSCGTNNLTLSGTVAHSGGSPFSTGANLVTYNGAGLQNILGGTYGGNLTITGGNKTFVTAVSSIAGTFLMDANVAGAQNVNFNGNVSYTSGTVNYTGGTITYANALAQNVISGTYSGLALNGGAKTLIAGATELDVNGTFTQDANFSTGVNNATFSAGVIYTSGILSTGINQVTYDGGNQSVLPAVYSGTLALLGTGTKTLLGTTQVTGDFTLNTGALTCGTNLFTLNGLVNYVVGTFTAGLNTVTYGRFGNQDVLAGTYSGSIAFSGSGVKTLLNNSAIVGAITIPNSITFNLNGKTLTTSNDITINNGGTLDVNDLAVLRIANTRVITNNGTLKVVGTAGNIATITRVTGNYSIIQNTAGATFHAQYYLLDYLGAGGVQLLSGTLNATNNFSNGTFTNGTGPQYLDLSGINFVSYNAPGVVFGAGPTNNVKRTSGTGTITFQNASGALSGENFDNDNGNPGTLINWSNPASTYYSQATNNFSNLLNWNTNPGGGGSNPVAADLTNGLSTFIVQNTHVVTIDQNIDVLALKVGSGLSGTVTVGNSVTGRLIVVRELLSVLNGGIFNVGAFNATHTLEIKGNIDNAGAIDLYNSSSQVVNVNFNGAATIIAGIGYTELATVNFLAASNTTANNALTIKDNVNINTNAIFQDGGLTHHVAGDWIEVGTGQMTGLGTIIFNGSGLQSVTAAATFNNVSFIGGAAANLTGVLTVNGNFIVDNNTMINTGTSHYVRGNFQIITGSLAQIGGTWYFDGATAQTIDGTNATFNAVNFANGGALPKTIINNLVATGLVTISSGSTVDGNGTQTISGGLRIDGTCNWSGLVSLNGNLTSGNLTLTLGNATLEARGTVYVTPTAATLNATVINNVNVINPGGQLVINDNAILTGSGANNLNVEPGRNLYIRGTNNFPVNFANYNLDPSSTAIYDAAFAQVIRGGVTYGNMSLTTDTKTVDGSCAILGSLSLNNYVIADFSGFSHTIGGDLNNALASCEFINNQTVTFNAPDRNQIINKGIYTFNNIEFTQTAPVATRTKTINSSITVNGYFSATNTGGSDVILLVVDQGAFDIYGAGGNFTLGSNVRFNTGETSNFADMAASFGTKLLDVTSTVYFNNQNNLTNQNIPGGFSYGNILFAGPGGINTNTKTALQSLDINGMISSAGGNNFFIDGGFAHTIAGDWMLAGANYTTPTSTITFDGANQNIGPANASLNFFNMVFAGSVVTTILDQTWGGYTVEVFGDVTINNGATVSTDNKAINIRGNWYNSGTGVFTQLTGATNFVSTTANQTVNQNATSVFGTIGINKPTPAFNTLTALSNLKVNLDVNYTASAANFDFTNRIIKIGRNWNLTTLTTFVANGSTVEFNGNVAQTIRNQGTGIYNNIKFTGAGTKTFYDAAYDVNGNWDIVGCTVNGRNIGIYVFGDWTNTGNFQHTDTVFFDGVNQSIGSSSFNSVSCINSGTKTLAGNITLNGALTINDGVTLDVSPSNYAISIEGNWNNPGTGIFNARTSTVTFAGAGSTLTSGTIAGPAFGKSFYNVFLNQNTGSTLSLAGDLIVTNDLTLNNGRLYSYAYDFYLSGHFNNINGVFNQNNNLSAINFIATTSKNFNPGTDPANVYRDIIFSAAPIVTYTLQNNLTVSSGRTIEINNGYFYLNGNTLSMTGAGAATVITLNGGALDINAGAQLLLANSNNVLNQGGVFKVVGTPTTNAVISRNNTTGYTINQTSGVFHAKYFFIQNTITTGITISGGTINSTNNFGEGIFAGGSGSHYLDVTGYNFGTGIFPENTVFSNGPTSNVKCLAATGDITFVNSTGSLTGEIFDNDGANFVKWKNEGFYWDGEAGDSDWNTPLNWTTNAVPTAVDTVYLNHSVVLGAYNVNITSANAVAAQLVIDKELSANGISLTLNNTRTLTIGGSINVLALTTLTATTASNTITIGGNWAVNGTFAPGLGTVVLNSAGGTKNINMAGSAFNNLTINGPGSNYILSSVLSVNNDLTITTGTFDVSSSNFALNVGGNWLNSGAGIFNPRLGTVTFNKSGTSTQTINGGPFYNFATTNATPATTATKQLINNTLIQQSVTIGANTLLDGTTNTHTVARHWINNSVLGFSQTGAGTIIFDGVSGQNIDNGTNATSFNNLTTQNGGGKTFFNNSNVNADFLISSTSGTVNVQTYTVTGVGASNSFSISGASQLTVQGANNFPKGFETINLASNSIVAYLANLNQTIFATTYGNLNLSANGGTVVRNKTADASYVVQTNINILDIYTRLDHATNNANVNLAGNVALPTGGLQMTWGPTGTLIHDGAGWNIDVDITGFNNMILSGSGTKTMLANLAITGDVTVQNGRTLTMQAFTMVGLPSKAFTLASGSILNCAIPSATSVAFATGFGTFNIDPASTVNLNNINQNQTVASNLTYGNLNITTGSTTPALATLNGNLTVLGNLYTSNNSSLTDAGNSFFLAGALNDIRTYNPTLTSTITLNGADQSIYDGNSNIAYTLDLANVVCAGTGTKTFGTGYNNIVNLKANVLIKPTVTFTSNRQINWSGSNFTNKGDFIHVGSAVSYFVFNGTSSQTMDAGVSNNFSATTNDNTGGTVFFVNNGVDFNSTFRINPGATSNMGALTHTFAASFYVGVAPAVSTINGTWITNNANLTFDGGNQVIPGLTAKNIIIGGTGGTKTITGTWNINDFTVIAPRAFNTSSTDPVSNNNTINLTGNWINDGNVNVNQSIVNFNGNTSPITIQTNGYNLYDVNFTPTLAVDYNLQSATNRFSRTVNVGANATLNLNGKNLILGSATALGKTYTIAGTLNVDAGAVLRFNNQTSTPVMTVSGALKVVGVSGNAATITKEGGGVTGFEPEITVTTGKIHAKYYLFEYLANSGLVLNSTASVDAVNNFSNGTWANMNVGGAGPRYYLVYNAPSAGTDISNVSFNLGGTAVIGTHYNVKRSATAVGVVKFVDPIAGTIGTFVFEDDDAAAATGRIVWPPASQVTWTGAVSTDWHLAGNWLPMAVPTILTDAIIPLVTNNPIISNDDAFCKNLDITNGSLELSSGKNLTVGANATIGTGASAAILAFTSSSSVMNVGGAWTRGANALFLHGNGSVLFNALAGSYTISNRTSSFYNVSFNGVGATYNLTGPTITIAKDVNINDAVIIPSAGYTFNLAGDYNNNNGTFSNTNLGVVVLNGAGAQALNNVDWYNLTVSGSGIKTFVNSGTINNILTVNSTISANTGAIITMLGNTTINASGTFDDGGETHIFRGGVWTGTGNYSGTGAIQFERNLASQTINASKFNTLLLRTNNGSVTIAGNVSTTGDVDLMLPNTGNSLNLQTFNIVNSNGAAAFNVAPSQNVYIRGANNSPTGFAAYNFDATSNTRYDAVMNQTIGALPYGNLILSAATVKTLAGDISVSNMTIGNSTLDVTTNNYTINVSGDWNNNTSGGAFLANDGNVFFDGSVTQNIYGFGLGNKDFNNLIINKPLGVINVSNYDPTIKGNLQVISGTFNINGNTATVGGNLVATGGIFQASGTYILNKTGGTANIQTNNSTLRNLTINGMGTVFTIQDNLNLDNIFTLTAGTVDANGRSVTLGNGSETHIISGTYKMGIGGYMRLPNLATVNVTVGGVIEVVGTTANAAVVTNTGGGGRYNFTIDGKIKARNYMFEFMNTSGIQVNAGAIIDPVDNFSDGTFNNGAAGTLLRIENTQSMQINNVSFPLNPGGGAFNVTKTTATTGVITFTNATGIFAGETFDNDPLNIIIWDNPNLINWIGAVSTDWYTPNNWSPAQVPTAVDDAVITNVPNKPIITVAGAICKNLTINNNSSVTVTTAAGGSDLVVMGDILIYGTLNQSTSNDFIHVGGNWTKPASGTVNLNGTIVFDAIAGSKTINNGTGLFNVVEINAPANYSLAANTILKSNLTITQGSLDVTASNYTLTIRGNFINNGVFDAKAGLVVLNPTVAGAYILNTGNSSFFNLNIAGVAGSSYQLVSNTLSVNGNCNITSGTLNLNSLPFIMGDGVGVDILTLTGVLNINQNASLELGNNASVVVNSGGRIIVVGTSATQIAKITRSAASAGRYSFAVNSGATIEAAYYLFEYMNTNGVQINTGAIIDPTNNFSFGEFSNGASGGRYLLLANNFASYTATRVIFNGGPNVNVRRVSGTGVITFEDASGVRATQLFEDDDLSATTGLIRWSFTNATVFWTGNVSTDWNDAGNWVDISLNNFVPDINTNAIVNDVRATTNRFPLLSSGANGVCKNLLLFPNSSVTLSSNKSLNVEGDVTIVALSTLTVTPTSASTITVANLWANAGVFNAGQSTVNFTAPLGNISITPNGYSFYNLSIGGIANFQTGGSITALNNLIINAGSLEVADASHNITVGGNWQNNGGLFIPNTGTVFLNRASGSQTIFKAGGETFNNLNISATGNKTVTLTSNINVNGNLSLSGTNNTLSGSSFTINLKGNWTNTGKVFAAATGTVILSGSLQQSVTRNAGEVFNNLVVNNSAPTSPQVLFLRNVDVNGVLTLINGKVETASTRILSMGAASSVSGGNANSFIDGPMTKVGSAGFTFPVGKANRFAPIQIDPPSSSSTFFAEYYNQSPFPTYSTAKDASIVNVSLLEYWILNRTAGTGSTSVTLHWRDASASAINSMTDLLVTRFDGATWKNIGNVTTTGGVGPGVSGTIKSNLVNTFSPFTFANKTLGVNLLPIELLAFDAKANKQNKVDLTWTTASERNSDYFEVERSADGKLFETIDKVKAAGNSSTNLNYSYIDSKPFAGVSYYRLNLVDINGDAKYSEVRSVSIAAKELSLAVYPNPFDGNVLSVRGTSLSNITHYASITDAIGKTVYITELTPENGSLETKLELENRLKPGMYFLSISNGTDYYNFKLIVK